MEIKRRIIGMLQMSYKEFILVNLTYFLQHRQLYYLIPYIKISSYLNFDTSTQVRQV